MFPIDPENIKEFVKLLVEHWWDRGKKYRDSDE